MPTIQLPQSTVFAHDLDQFLFLKGLGEEEKEKLASFASLLEVPRGFHLASENQSADAFYIVSRGMLAISMRLDNGTEVVSQRVGPQGICGWSWIVPPHTWSFNVTALENSVVLAFAAADLRRLFDENPRMGYEIMRKMTTEFATRLQDTRRQLYGRRLLRPSRGVEL